MFSFQHLSHLEANPLHSVAKKVIKGHVHSIYSNALPVMFVDCSATVLQEMIFALFNYSKHLVHLTGNLNPLFALHHVQPVKLMLSMSSLTLIYNINFNCIKLTTESTSSINIHIWS